MPPTCPMLLSLTDELPCIVNDMPIGAKEDVLLGWEIVEKKKEVKTRSWVDDVVRAEQKRAKSTHSAEGSKF